MVVMMLAYLWLHPTPHWKAFAPICKAADVLMFSLDFKK
jgi:hypothetical protein